MSKLETQRALLRRRLYRPRARELTIGDIDQMLYALDHPKPKRKAKKANGKR